MIQDNLGNLYRGRNDFPKAEEALLKALELRRRLAKVNPQTYEPDLAMTQNNLGNLYSSKSDFLEAEKVYLEALQIYKRLTKKNLQAYGPALATIQNNLGALFSGKNEFSKAEESYLEALQILKKLAKENLQIYAPDLAGTLNNLGVLYKKKTDFAKAEETYLEALEIYRRLAREYPQMYEPSLARAQRNLALVYWSAKNYDHSEKLFIESFNIMFKWANVSPEQHARDLRDISWSIIRLYSAKLDSLTYNTFKHPHNDNFMVIEDRLYTSAKSNPELVTELTIYCGNRAWYLLFAARFDEAERVGLKGLELNGSQTWIKTNIAHALLFQGKYEKALEIYRGLKLQKNRKNESYAIICLAQLDELEKHGITHKDVDRIRAFLKQQ
jgi:tetratricopeptide (TPR) repeat protein